MVWHSHLLERCSKLTQLWRILNIIILSIILKVLLWICLIIKRMLTSRGLLRSIHARHIIDAISHGYVIEGMILSGVEFR